MDPAANCLIELTKSVTGKGENSLAVFQGPEKHSHFSFQD